MELPGTLKAIVSWSTGTTTSSNVLKELCSILFGAFPKVFLIEIRFLSVHLNLSSLVSFSAGVTSTYSHKHMQSENNTLINIGTIADLLAEAVLKGSLMARSRPHELDMAVIELELRAQALKLMAMLRGCRFKSLWRGMQD